MFWKLSHVEANEKNLQTTQKYILSSGHGLIANRQIQATTRTDVACTF